MNDEPLPRLRISELLRNATATDELPSLARTRKLSRCRRDADTARSEETSIPGWFEPDHCANCMSPLPQRVDGLFCTEFCQGTAKLVRYWRGVNADGRVHQPDIQDALRVRIAHWLAGGYPERERSLPPAVREQVKERDQGLCRGCGEPGQEIDHIDGNSSQLSNLQLLCKPCHDSKTELRMVMASPEDQQKINTLERDRVIPDEPTLLCDSHLWNAEWRQLKSRRRTRLLGELADYGYTRDDFRGTSWQDLWDRVLAES